MKTIAHTGSVIAAVEAGKLVFRLSNNREVRFGLADRTAAETFCRENGIDECMCSSSCDFPEDYGLPKETNVRAWIQAVLYSGK